MQKNWDANVVEPYNKWDTVKLTNYLKVKGVETKESAEDTRESLLARVKNSWYESEDKTQAAYANVKDWILDTWTDSQLKAFCDRHGIPVPQPRKRDTLLQKVRENYETVAQKAGEAAAYPGNWLYETWTGACIENLLSKTYSADHYCRIRVEGMARHSWLSCPPTDYCMFPQPKFIT